MDSTKAEEAIKQMGQLKIDLKSPNLFFAQFEDLVEKAGFNLLHPETNLNLLRCLPEWLLCKVCDPLKPENYVAAKNKALGIIKSQQAVDGILQKITGFRPNYNPNHNQNWQQSQNWRARPQQTQPYTGNWQPPAARENTQFNSSTTPSWYKDF